MSLLSVHGLAREPWFRGFDLQLEAGEVVVLRGASGCGKTLLLRALADLDPADAGEVALRGTPREEVAAPAWRARVLYVHPEGARLAGTVAGNLQAVGALRAQQGRDLAGDVEGLDARAEVGRLSSGEAQRLALTRALRCAPDVLLLDEPTSSMDPEAARAWEARLVAWAAEGRGIVWITHDDGLAARVGGRTVRFP